MTTLTQALLAEFESAVTFAAKILKKSEIITYTTKQGAERKFFELTVGDAVTSTRLRVYQQTKQAFFREDRSYQFLDVIRKNGETDFWFVSTSKAHQGQNVHVPEKVRTKAIELTGEDFGKSNAARNVDAALTSPTTSTIRVKVMQVSPVKRVRDGEMQLRHLAVRDTPSSKPVKVALFNDDAARIYSPGDVLQISSCYPWKKEKSTDCLSTTRTCSIDFLPGTELEHVEIIALHDDSDFEDRPPEPSLTGFTVTGVCSACIYEACPKPACKSKKIKNGICPSCDQGCEQGAKKTCCYAKLVFDLSGGETRTLTVFTSDLLKIVPTLTPAFMSEEELMDAICNELPVKGRAFFSQDKISCIIMKRRADGSQSEDEGTSS